MNGRDFKKGDVTTSESVVTSDENEEEFKPACGGEDMGRLSLCT